MKTFAIAGTLAFWAALSPELSFPKDAQSNDRWEADSEFWGARTRRHRIDVITFQDAKDFLHVIDSESAPRAKVGNLAQSAQSQYMGFDQKYHYARILRSNGPKLFQISRQHISDPDIKSALARRRVTTVKLPVEFFNEGLHVLIAMHLDKSLMPDAENDETHAKAQIYRHNVAIYSLLLNHKIVDDDVRTLRKRIGKDGEALLKEILVTTDSEAAVLKLLGKPARTIPLGTGSTPTKVAHQFYGSNMDEIIFVYCAEGKVIGHAVGVVNPDR